MPAVLERFRHMYPDVELDLREMTVAEQVDALVRGIIDVGLLRPPATDPRIAMVSILEEGFLLVVPKGHALAGAGSVPPARLAGEPFIMFSERQSPLFHSRIMRMCEGAGFSPNVVQHATQIHTVVGLVGAGMGVAVVPETARNLHISGTRFLRIAQAPEPVQVALAWRRDNETPAVRSFRQVALLVAQQMRADRRLVQEQEGAAD